MSFAVLPRGFKEKSNKVPTLNTIGKAAKNGIKRLEKIVLADKVSPHKADEELREDQLIKRKKTRYEITKSERKGREKRKKTKRDQNTPKKKKENTSEKDEL